MLAYGNPLIVSVVSHIHGTKLYFGLCHKTEGVLGGAQLFCLSPLPNLPKFLLFPLTDPHLPILHLSNYTNGPQQMFSPKPAPPCCPTPAAWISHKDCQASAWKLRDIAFVLLSLLLNEGQTCPHLSLNPGSLPMFVTCSLLSHREHEGLEDTTWGFLSSRPCLGPCSSSVLM